MVLVAARSSRSGGRGTGSSRGAEDILIEPYLPAEVVARVRAVARTRDLQEALVDQSRRFETMLSRIR